MKFKGNIIITDPCYFVKNNRIEMPSEYAAKEPKDTDYMKFGIYEKDYPDAIPKNPNEYTSQDISMIDLRKGIAEACGHPLTNPWIPMKSVMHDECFEAYLKAYHDWKAPYMSDWEKSGCGDDMDVLGLKTWLTSSTGYGDWSCTVYQTPDEKAIGEFCADAAMVGVFLLDEILSYNPEFDYHKSPWAYTLIKDFDGEINIINEDMDNVYVEGKGNINFHSCQTGF